MMILITGKFVSWVPFLPGLSPSKNIGEITIPRRPNAGIILTPLGDSGKIADADLALGDICAGLDEMLRAREVQGHGLPLRLCGSIG